MTKNKDNKILWDSKNDCFVYMKKGASKPTYLPNTQEVKDVAPYDYFEILNELPADGKIPDSQTYSVYLAGNAYTGTVETPVGFDAGKNAVSKVTFKTTEERSVLINTNGGEFEVEAEQASVEHRGEATIVTIKAVYDKSYHENGKVNEIKLEKGRVVVEPKAEVGSILVTAAAGNKADAKIEIKDSATLGAIGAMNFDISKESGIITGADKTEVVADATGNSNFAGGFGTEKAPYLISTIGHLKNVNNSTGKFFKIVCDLNASISDMVNGTLLNEYEVKTLIPSLKRDCVIDGNGHFIQLPEVHHGQYEWPAELVTNLYGTLKNLTVKIDNGGVVAGFSRYGTFENVTVEGYYAVSGNCAAYVTYGCGATFIDCVNKAYMQGTGSDKDYNAIFVGWNAGNGYTYSFTNCVNKGVIVAGKAAMYVGNTGKNRMILVANGCKNEGSIVSTYMKASYKPDYLVASHSNDALTLKLDNDSKNLMNTKNGPTDAEMTIKMNDDKTFTITKSEYNVKYYVVTITIYTNLADGSGTNRFVVTERIESTGADSYKTNLKFLRFAEKTDDFTDGDNIAGNATIVKDGETFYLVAVDGETLNGELKTATSVSVAAFDQNGKLISSVATN